MSADQPELLQDETMRSVAERLRFHIENTPLAVIECDRDYHVTRWSRRAVEIFGWSEEEVIGKRITDIRWVHEDDVEAVQAIARDMDAGREFRNVHQNRNYRKDGSLVYCEWYNSALCDEHGKLQSVFSLVLDVTDREQARRAVEHQSAELLRSNEELQRFAYTVSHDLQEPLRMITAFTQLLAKKSSGKFGTDTDETVTLILEASDRMSKLIKSLLAYSRVGESADVRKKMVDLNAILAATLQNLSFAIRDSGTHVTHESLPVLLADEAQMGQLFQNLIGNAIKYRSEQPPEIHVTASRAGGEWMISVADNGIGFAPENSERIFGVFKRLHGREYTGTGIGLAICKKIVERHGGRIWAEGEEGRGATFHFTLPAGQG